MPYVLAFYDISDDSRRARAAERLLALGFSRVQRSVYIARGGRGLARDAMRALAPLIDPGRDSLVVMVVPGESVSSALRLGGAPLGGRVEGGLIL